MKYNTYMNNLVIVNFPISVPCKPFQGQVIVPHAAHGSISLTGQGARCSSVVRAFAHGAIGRLIDPSWGGPIKLFLVPASAPQLV